MSGDIDAFLDCLAPLGPVRPRRMFGGTGIFLDGVMFALEIGDVLYLKVDSLTIDRFREAGCEPFTYSRKGRSFAMSYWTLPDACLDDPDETLAWARSAVAAAFRSRA